MNTSVAVVDGGVLPVATRALDTFGKTTILRRVREEGQVNNLVELRTSDSKFIKLISGLRSCKFADLPKIFKIDVLNLSLDETGMQHSRTPFINVSLNDDFNYRMTLQNHSLDFRFVKVAIWLTAFDIVRKGIIVPLKPSSTIKSSDGNIVYDVINDDELGERSVQKIMEPIDNFDYKRLAFPLSDQLYVVIDHKFKKSTVRADGTIDSNLPPPYNRWQHDHAAYYSLQRVPLRKCEVELITLLADIAVSGYEMYQTFIERFPLKFTQDVILNQEQIFKLADPHNRFQSYVSSMAPAEIFTLTIPLMERAKATILGAVEETLWLRDVKSTMNMLSTLLRVSATQSSLSSYAIQVYLSTSSMSKFLNLCISACINPNIMQLRFRHFFTFSLPVDLDYMAGFVAQALLPANAVIESSRINFNNYVARILFGDFYKRTLTTDPNNVRRTQIGIPHITSNDGWRNDKEDFMKHVLQHYTSFTTEARAFIDVYMRLDEGYPMADDFSIGGRDPVFRLSELSERPWGDGRPVTNPHLYVSDSMLQSATNIISRPVILPYDPDMMTRPFTGQHLIKLIDAFVTMIGSKSSDLAKTFVTQKPVRIMYAELLKSSVSGLTSHFYSQRALCPRFSFMPVTSHKCNWDRSVVTQVTLVDVADAASAAMFLSPDCDYEGELPIILDTDPELFDIVPKTLIRC